MSTNDNIWTDKFIEVFIGMSSGFALLMIVPIAVGQSLALGFREALKLYGLGWLTFVAQLVGSTAVIACVVVVLRKVGRRLSWRKVFVVVGPVLFIAVLLAVPSYIFWRLARMAYEDERQRLEVSSPPTDPASAVKALSQQDVALKELSEDGKELLSRLDGTLNETAALRRDLAQTIAEVERQRRMVEEAYESTLELGQRQYIIQNRTARIRNLLGGQDPISRSDLIKAGRTALWQGVVIGVLTSVLGSFVYRWLSAVARRRRKGKSTGGGVAA